LRLSRLAAPPPTAAKSLQSIRLFGSVMRTPLGSCGLSLDFLQVPPSESGTNRHSAKHVTDG